MNTTTQALATAIAVREGARGRHESAAAALERAREVAAECQQEADRLAAEESRWVERHSKKITAWIEAGGRGARPAAVADAKVVQAQMSARANAAAAAESLAQFEQAGREATDALARAEADVKAAAHEVLLAEVRADLDVYCRLQAEANARRERLWAAYLGGARDAVSPEEWLELDVLLGAPSELMDIGSPWLDIPINHLEQTGARDRPREARTRIDALIPEFQARLAELVRSDARSQEKAA